jgi:hypothetical protein
MGVIFSYFFEIPFYGDHLLGVIFEDLFCSYVIILLVVGFIRGA